MRCPECQSSDIINIGSEVMCRSCSLVLDDAPIESNTYMQENKQATATLPELATAGSKPVGGRMVKHTWLLTTKQKNLEKSNQIMQTLVSRLHLPDFVFKEAKVLYQRAISKDLSVGRDNLSITYACIYASCMIHNLPKTPLEVVFRSEVTRHKMLKSYKLLKQELGIRVEPMDPIDLWPRFANKLALSQETITLALQLAVKTKGTRVALGRHPRTMVASILYVACKLNNEPITQRAVANATGCIEVTIRKRSREIT